MLCAGSLAAPLPLNPGVYDVTVETVLPHLEENLRYSTIRQRQCLGTNDAESLFPLLLHPALAGCALVGGQTFAERVEFSLRCRNPEAATGTARLRVNANGVYGVLEIKMGGKNMTLSQRISAPRLGGCAMQQ